MFPVLHWVAPRLLTKIMCYFADLQWRYFAMGTEYWGRAKFHFYGHKVVPDRENCIVVMNHLSILDWLYILNIAGRRGRTGCVKYFAKVRRGKSVGANCAFRAPGLSFRAPLTYCLVNTVFSIFSLSIPAASHPARSTGKLHFLALLLSLGLPFLLFRYENLRYLRPERAALGSHAVLERRGKSFPSSWPFDSSNSPICRLDRSFLSSFFFPIAG